mgnify:CR=1 FL=1
MSGRNNVCYSKTQILYIKWKTSFYTPFFRKSAGKSGKEDLFWMSKQDQFLTKNGRFRKIREKNRKKEDVIYRKKERKTHFFFRKKEVFDVVSSKIFQIGLKCRHIFRKIFRIKIKNRKKGLYRPPVYPCVNNVFHAVWRVCPGSKKGLL